MKTKFYIGFIDGNQLNIYQGYDGWYNHFAIN